VAPFNAKVQHAEAGQTGARQAPPIPALCGSGTGCTLLALTAG
jgi:hypothetical protein